MKENIVEKNKKKSIQLFIVLYNIRMVFFFALSTWEIHTWKRLYKIQHKTRCCSKMFPFPVVQMIQDIRIIGESETTAL